MPWWLVLLEGIFAVIIGISLLSQTAMTVSIIVRILGLYWFLGGILAIVSIFINRSRWGLKLLAGIVGIIAGLLVILNPIISTILIPSLIVSLIAVGGVVIGLIDIVRAFRGAGLGTGVLGILSIILGLLILLNPLYATFASAIVVGLVAIGGGVIAILMAFRLR
jgi:uncharacterized membrane protein HdeD (DUF308 family)